MEEVEFEQWLESLKNIEIKYSAVYDPNTMKFLKIGPSHALEGEDNCIEVQKDIAERILSGEVNIHSCYLDIKNNEVAITETKKLLSIDDILHRIPSLEWSSTDEYDVYLKFDKENKLITLQLGAQWGGTYKNFSNEILDDRRIQWSGDTMMEFLITDYNDPNIVHDFFSVPIDSLMNNDFQYDVTIFDQEVSIYTRRIFKNYVVECV